MKFCKLYEVVNTATGKLERQMNYALELEILRQAQSMCLGGTKAIF